MGYYISLNYDIDRVYRVCKNTKEPSWRTWWSSMALSKIMDTVGITECDARIIHTYKTDLESRGYSGSVVDSNTHEMEINIYISKETAAFVNLKYPSITLWHESHSNAFINRVTKPNAKIKRAKHGIKIEHDWHVPGNEEDYILAA